MRPSVSRDRFALFRCPVCRGDLALAERRLTCINGHGFDLARSGYVNLAMARRHARAVGGDAREQLEHRARFLARGHFDFIADIVAARADCRRAILDIGCGTGFHLARIVERAAASIGAGIDLSKDAAAWCARRHPALEVAVADIWNRWPIHDGSVDLVTSIFAPKNYAEMARVLRPDGLLVLVFPGPRHLEELRRAFGLLGVAADKADAYTARLARDFGAPARQRVVRRVTLELDEIEDVILMGPSARHLAGFCLNGGRRGMATTIDVQFLFAGLSPLHRGG